MVKTSHENFVYVNLFNDRIPKQSEFVCMRLSRPLLRVIFMSQFAHSTCFVQPSLLGLAGILDQAVTILLAYISN